MKKFLLAVAASAIIFSGQAGAAPADDLNVKIGTQETGRWTDFRDEYILGRETKKERRARENRERRHRYEPPPSLPPHYHDGKRRYQPPTSPPPPYYRDGKRRYQPPMPQPPPPYYRGDKRYYPPPTSPPPPHHR